MNDTSVPAGDAVGATADAPITPDVLPTTVDALVARLEHQRLEVLPFYHDLRNQIVHPLNLHVETRYFFRKWKSELGPVLTLLIMELRDRCYYNPRTGERRDYCWPSQEELARAIGVSIRTVIRALQDPRAATFIRVQHRYRYDSTMGKKVRTSSAYVVAMDDPLRPEDEATLTRMVAEQILSEETAQRDRLLAGSADGLAPPADGSLGHPRGERVAAESGTKASARRPRSQTRPADLRVTMSGRTQASPEARLGDNLTGTSKPPLTDKLTDINITATLSEEEVPYQGDTQKKDQDFTPPFAFSASAAANALPEAVAETYAAANDRAPTSLERQRLVELVSRFDPAARAASPASTGAEWVVAAIVEAVDSGSAFVAPRRIATICDRWARAARGRAGGTGSHRTGGKQSHSADRWPPDAGATESETEEVPVDPFEPAAEPVVPSFVVSSTRPVANWQLWRLVTDELSRQPMGSRHRSWLEQAAIVGEEGDALVVGAPTRFARDLLERRLGDDISRVVAAALGEARPLRFVVSRDWLEQQARTENRPAPDPGRSGWPPPG